MIAQEELKRWAKEQGFAYIKQTNTLGIYFRADKDGFANMIRWDYDDCYYLKWQVWIGNDKERPKRSKIYHIPEREIYLCAETDSVQHCDYYAFFDMVDHIKFSSDRMIKKCKNNIKKRFE